MSNVGRHIRDGSDSQLLTKSTSKPLPSVYMVNEQFLHVLISPADDADDAAIIADTDDDEDAPI